MRTTTDTDTYFLAPASVRAAFDAFVVQTEAMLSTCSECDSQREIDDDGYYYCEECD